MLDMAYVARHLFGSSRPVLTHEYIAANSPRCCWLPQAQIAGTLLHDKAQYSRHQFNFTIKRLANRTTPLPHTFDKPNTHSSAILIRSPSNYKSTCRSRNKQLALRRLVPNFKESTMPLVSPKATTSSCVCTVVCCSAGFQLTHYRVHLCRSPTRLHTCKTDVPEHLRRLLRSCCRLKSRGPRRVLLLPELRPLQDWNQAPPLHYLAYVANPVVFQV